MAETTKQNENLNKRLGDMLNEIANPKKDKANEFTKSTYESLNAVLDVVKPVMEKYGFYMQQYAETTYIGQFENECKLTLHTKVRDKKQGTIVLSDSRPLLLDANSQKMGSAETYARRYSIRTIFGLAAEDDDGNLTANNGGNYYGN